MSRTPRILLCILAIACSLTRAQARSLVRVFALADARCHQPDVVPRGAIEKAGLLVRQLRNMHDLAADSTLVHKSVQERRQVLLDALAELPSTDREFLILLVREPPCTYAEISETLNMPIGSIGPTRRRAIEKLLQTKAVQSHLQKNRNTAPVQRLGVPARAATRVADLATRVLPVAHRARYRDEYQSELYEISSAGASWWQQMMYAIRLLDRSWELRFELRQQKTRRVRS